MPTSCQNTRVKKVKHALHYARYDWDVFPLYSIDSQGRCTCGENDCDSPGKHPCTKHGFRDATTDTAQILDWWKRWPDANIGFALPPGVFVLDVDPRHRGDDTLARLEQEHGGLPETVECLTGGGGRHLYFQGVADKSTLGPGIDVQHGGASYVILPPSNHLSGDQYKWRFSRPPQQVSIAPVPPWLLGVLSGGDGSRTPATRAG